MNVLHIIDQNHWKCVIVNRPLIKVSLKVFYSMVNWGLMGYDTENRGTVATNFEKREQEIIIWTWEKEW